MEINSISDFYAAGVSYRNLDAAARGRFALSREQIDNVYAAAVAQGIGDCFILSTCNRTEIYGFASDPKSLVGLLCSQTGSNADQFAALGYIKKDFDALDHLFRVAAGLDSQLLGDYEIVGQLRRSVEAASGHGLIGIALNRMVNDAVRATRQIRSRTGFSSGTVSVAFAAVQSIRQQFGEKSVKNIVLLGTGKIGGNACKYLRDFFPDSSVTVINRTEEKAIGLAVKFGFDWAPMNELSEKLSEADAILVATASESPLLRAGHITGKASKTIIDFSVPCNVDPEVGLIPGIRLLGIDELSRVKDETLSRRAAEIPVVESILEEYMKEFTGWLEQRRHVPFLRAVKNKLHSLQVEEGSDATEQRIQKVINGVAVKMRTHHLPGCHYLEAINDFMGPEIVLP